MIVTVSSEGQITIPLSFREKLNLKAGDELELDESGAILTARRVKKTSDWEETLTNWQMSATKALEGHKWEKLDSTAIVDELRGGPAGRSCRGASTDPGGSARSQ